MFQKESENKFYCTSAHYLHMRFLVLSSSVATHAKRAYALYDGLLSYSYQIPNSLSDQGQPGHGINTGINLWNYGTVQGYVAHVHINSQN